jgi:transcriptional regulator with XRE-family HTH domain
VRKAEQKGDAMKGYSDEVAARFADNLVRCRKRAGLSQEELGYRSSIHRTQVGNLERGKRMPRIETLVKLAGSLGVPPEELIRGIEWEPGYVVAVDGGFAVADLAEPADENGSPPGDSVEAGERRDVA